MLRRGLIWRSLPGGDLLRREERERKEALKKENWGNCVGSSVHWNRA